MNLQPRLKFVPKLLVLLLCSYIFAPGLVLASTYGSNPYGSCLYQKGCSTPSSPNGMDVLARESFLNKYQWLIFAGFILLLLVILLYRRHQKSVDKDVRPPTLPPKT